MTGGVIDISTGRLALGFLFVAVAGLTSLVHGLKLEKSLLVGAVRTVAQLFLLGYVLKFIFNLNNAYVVLLLFLIMLVFAAWTIRGRVQERQIRFWWPVFISMTLSYGLVSIMVTGLIVGARPWWQPQYFIPLAGMIVGNSMNAITLALERLFNDLRLRRPEVEMKLCLGAEAREASQDIVAGAMRAGMIPSINSMMAVGIVFIPGMMTGQILAGSDPLTAIRYQIVVMLMLVGSTAIGSLLVVLLVRRLCFGPGDRLLLRPKRQ